MVFDFVTAVSERRHAYEENLYCDRRERPSRRHAGADAFQARRGGARPCASRRSAAAVPACAVLYRRRARRGFDAPAFCGCGGRGAPCAAHGRAGRYRGCGFRQAVRRQCERHEKHAGALPGIRRAAARLRQLGACDPRGEEPGGAEGGCLVFPGARDGRLREDEGGGDAGGARRGAGGAGRCGRASVRHHRAV